MHSGNQELEQLRQEWLTSHCDMRCDCRQPLFEQLMAWLQQSDADPDGAAVPLRADVVDRSSGGLCLAVASPCSFQPGDGLQLTIHTGSEPERHRVRVCWREDNALIVALGVAYDES